MGGALVRTMDARPPSPGLNELRDELARIDREVVELLAERLKVARRAIRLRVAAGEGVTNRTQERLVRERARRWAVERGVSPELADRVFRELIRCGKAGSRRSHAPSRFDSPGSVGSVAPRSAAIVGGSGPVG